MSAPCPTFGFIVHVSPDHDGTAVHTELAARLADTGLVVSSAGTRSSDLVVTRDGTQATESDRQLVIELLSPVVSADAVNVSDLVDLSY
jgi:hypothetical protein